MGSNRDRFATFIVTRSWKELRRQWSNHLPIIPEPGSTPTHCLSDLEEIEYVIPSTNDGEVHEVDQYDCPGLRACLLHESLSWLHKSANVLASAQLHVSSGFSTWSVSVSYQASYFAMQALLGLLGISIFSFKQKTYLIDVWALPEKTKNRKVNMERFIALRMLGGVALHKMHWITLSRIARITSDAEDLMGEDLAKLLKTAAPNKYAFHRNELHYRSNKWHFEDIRSQVTDTCFDRQFIDNDPDDPSFPILVAFALMRTCREMLRTLADNAPSIAPEFNLLDGWLNDPINKQFQNSYAI